MKPFATTIKLACLSLVLNAHAMAAPAAMLAAPDYQIMTGLFKACDEGAIEVPKNIWQLMKKHSSATQQASIKKYFEKHSARVHKQALALGVQEMQKDLAGLDHKMSQCHDSNETADLNSNWQFHLDYQFAKNTPPTEDEIPQTLEEGVQFETPTQKYGKKLTIQGTIHIALERDKIFARAVAKELVRKTDVSRPDFIYLEGIKANMGVNPCQSIIMAYMDEQDPGAEMKYLIRYAVEKNIPFAGNEPSLKDEVELAGDDFQKFKMAFRYPDYITSENMVYFNSILKLGQKVSQVMAVKNDNKPFKLDKLPKDYREYLLAPLFSQAKALTIEELPKEKDVFMEKVAEFYFTYVKKDQNILENKERLIESFLKEDLAELYKRTATKPEVSQEASSNTFFAFQVEARDAFMRQNLIKKTSQGKRVTFVVGKSHLETNHQALSDHYKN